MREYNCDKLADNAIKQQQLQHHQTIYYYQQHHYPSDLLNIYSNSKISIYQQTKSTHHISFEHVHQMEFISTLYI